MSFILKICRFKTDTFSDFLPGLVRDRKNIILHDADCSNHLLYMSRLSEKEMMFFWGKEVVDMN